MENRNHYRHHSSEGCFWAKGAIIDIIALRNMFMGKANHCRDHSSGECLWNNHRHRFSGGCLCAKGTIIHTIAMRNVYGQSKPL